MRSRGMQFINVPDSYYEDLKAKLAKSKVTVQEDLGIVSAVQSVAVHLYLSTIL